MPGALPEDWRAVIEILLGESGAVMVLGLPDSGKTTFSLALANAAVVRGTKCAVVDADTGQSEIGPPTTVGMAEVERPTRSYADVEPLGLFFTGNTSPPRRLLQTATGISTMSREARQLSQGLTIVDMPGFVAGDLALSFVESVFDLVSPDHVVGIERGGELGRIIALVRGLRSPRFHRIAPPPGVRRRSPEERTARRGLKLAAYFSGAVVEKYDGMAVGITGEAIFAGDQLRMDERLRIESAGIDVVYGERLGGRVLIVSSSAPPAGVREKLAAAVAERDIAVIPAGWFSNIVAGLVDENGRHLAIGILESIDFERRKFIVRSPVRQPAAVKKLVLGAMRIRADGTELGPVRASVRQEG